MNKKKRFLINQLIAFCIVLLFSNSCEKEGENSTIIDIDGNVYTTVKISTQVWMAENLKVTKYRNGDLIGTTSPATLDLRSESTPKYEWAYNGDESNVATYGRLYTWFAITDSRHVCPSGWHVPTDAEWTTLTDFLGGLSVAGGKLKETGTTHWLSPNVGATNETGFTALPGRFRNYRGSFNTYVNKGFWWSSTETSIAGASSRVIYYDYSYVSNYGDIKKNGLSIRCIKD